MNLGLYFLRSKNSFYYAILVDQISCAQNANGLSATSNLLAPTSERLQQSCLGIGNKRKLQPFGFGKLLLQSLLVLAHANNLVSCCSQLVLMCL